MSIVANVRIPTEEFTLGEIFKRCPGTAVEFEQVVPLDGSWPLLFRVEHGADMIEAVETALENHQAVKRVRRFDCESDDHESLFELHLDSVHDTLTRAVADSEGYVLAAKGEASTWEFQLQFSDHEGLHRFNESLTEAGIPVTLQRLHNPRQSDEVSLSSEQREAVRIAYQRGYFEVPRQCTLEVLADEVGISDSAFSQRLRRGVAACIQDSLDLS